MAVGVLGRATDANARAFGHRWHGEKPAPVAFFTERSLASFLAVSDRTIRNWISRGELPSYKRYGSATSDRESHSEVVRLIRHTLKYGDADHELAEQLANAAAQPLP